MGRILAVDLGSRRVGLAITDPLRMLASPLGQISYRGEGPLVCDLLSLAAEKEVERVVVGLPLRSDGSEAEGCRRARRLARRLQESGLEALLWDESYSSREARSALREMGVSGRSSSGRVDRLAAALILRDYLASLGE
jgi:putative Holliday junction resolvase